MALVSDWLKLGNIFFRKGELYNMQWDRRLNLDDFIVAAAPIGGPIALIRKRNIGGRSQEKPLVFIFSSCGSKISSFNWTGGSLIHVGWSKKEELICIQEDGAVSLYDVFGNYLSTFSMGQEAKERLVKDAKIFPSFHETGIAVLTKSNAFLIKSNMSDRTIRKFIDIKFPFENFEINYWCLIREDRQTTVLISSNNKILRLDAQENCFEDTTPKWSGSNECVVCMATTVDYHRLALLTDKGRLWMGTSDLEIIELEYSLETTASKPRSVTWCGTSAVAILWDLTLELITITGESTLIYLDSMSFLVQELDAIRIISSSSHDILHKVPNVVVETLGIGSMAPGALLFEASQAYQERRTEANDCLAVIKKSMEMAVKQCYDSARFQFDSNTQKLLLKAALFGKIFVSEMNPENYTSVVTTLRILNAIRDPNVGMPLTWNQLEYLTVPALLDRLVNRRLFPLALKIAQYLKIDDAQGASKVISDWACYKVKQQSDKSDEVIAQEIHDRMGFSAAVSYYDVAKIAESCNKKKLALKLIDYECSAQKQVTMLLRLGEHLKALKRAIHSGDTGLVHAVFPHLQDKNQAEFLMLIRNFPVARSLYLDYCKQSTRERVLDVYVQDDDFDSQAKLKIEDAFMSKGIDSELASLQSAYEDFKKSKNEINAQITYDQIKLIKTQIGLEVSEGKAYVNKSLYDTVINLIKDGRLKEADKIRSEFKMTDRRYCYLRVYGLAEAQNWSELNNFSKNKKLVIPIESFVDACLKFGPVEEARKYLPRVKDERKIVYYIKCGLIEEALTIAEETKNAASLQDLTAACINNPQLQARIQNLTEAL